MTKLLAAAAALALAASMPAGAQYTPQTPSGRYPPSAYPGQYPRPPIGPGSGVSFPSRHKHHKNDESAEPLLKAAGRTVSNDGKKLVVAVSDGRTLTMTVTPHTKFTRSGNEIPASNVVPGTTVNIEAAEDDQDFLTATQVELVKDVQQTEESQQKLNLPAASSDGPEPPDRPILRRGAPPKDADATTVARDLPKKAKESDGSFDFTIDSPTPLKPPRQATDALIARTQEWVRTFTDGLPNYVCEQNTARYMEESRSSGWQAQDVITAQVVYDHGNEEYRDITVGGRRTNKSIMELGGTTTTGEFASMLSSLFDPARHANFTFYRSSSIGDTPASIYDFKVQLPDSDWLIIVGGQALRPVYSGSVWIDKATAQVRRIEMQADNVPKDFPFDNVQTAVDYDSVRLGTDMFLLPIHSEALSCQRGTTVCSKNVIDFRNYHKFEGKSTITFGK